MQKKELFKNDRNRKGTFRRDKAFLKDLLYQTQKTCYYFERRSNSEISEARLKAKRREKDMC